MFRVRACADIPEICRQPFAASAAV